MSLPLASSPPMFLFFCFLIKEVIAIVVVGDGGGCNRNIHISVSYYNMASIKQQVNLHYSSSL
jgi:hypothetical protein